MCEELKCMTQEEALRDMGHEEKVEYKVSKLLHYYLMLLSDLDLVKNLTHMLTNCMGEEGITVTISTLLPERDVCQVSKKKLLRS
jgi:hypothetical protein